MLTRKQYELLMFIHERVRETGIPPSFDEMKDALDLKSKSGIHRLITALEERGYLKRMEKRARALEVVKLPENIAETQHPAISRNQAQQMQQSQPRLVRSEARPDSFPSGNQEPAMKLPGSLMTGGRQGAHSNDSISVPLVGKIAAGVPIEALQNKVADVPVPVGMIGAGDHYALEVAGDSMIDAGILDGDTVIIRHADTANNGDIVVALIGGNEATLKRLRRRGDSIALEAANPAYGTRLYGADQVQVQGRLVGLIRHY